MSEAKCEAKSEAKSEVKSEVKSGAVFVRIRSLGATVLARVFVLVAIAAAFCAQRASGEDAFPNRPIRMIVPFPPGGPTDVMGRLISQSLSERLAQQVYVDNRPGAGSTLAGKIAATADPDGYTLLLASAATLAIGPTLYRDVEYDPKRFVPVAIVADVPYVMVAGPNRR
jgi:tripartite-type tricarboxylate transporter receptor subunit TctC